MAATTGAFRTMPADFLRAFFVVAIPLALAGCASEDKYPPACPNLKILSDAADITTYSGTGRDLTDLLLQARITGVPARCAPGDPGIVQAALRVGFDLTRGPASPAREIDLPYFVAIEDGGKVLAERDFRLHAIFPPNSDELRAEGGDVSLAITVTKEHSAAAYTIYVGFRLTPEQLQQNRTQKPRL